MIKRTLFFSNPYHLGSSMNQMVIKDKDNNTKKSLPVEDLGFVVFEHPQITFSHGLIQLFTENNVAVVFCNKKYLPTSMLLNLDGNNIQTKLFRQQLEASEPMKKNLWQQTIKRKIKNQASCLKIFGLDDESLLYKAKQVKSGDTTNEEAKAAVVYWKRLMGKSFKRERFGNPPNHYLNYGYAILRAAMARAITGSGLHPTLGIHHKNQYNSYCLADDLMEPYRPFIDLLVKRWIAENGLEEKLSTECKTYLLSILTVSVRMGNQSKPLMRALSSTTASLVSVFGQESNRTLKLPKF